MDPGRLLAVLRDDPVYFVVTAFVVGAFTRSVWTWMRGPPPPDNSPLTDDELRELGLDQYVGRRDQLARDASESFHSGRPATAINQCRNMHCPMLILVEQWDEFTEDGKPHSRLNAVFADPRVRAVLGSPPTDQDSLVALRLDASSPEGKLMMRSFHRRSLPALIIWAPEITPPFTLPSLTADNLMSALEKLKETRDRAHASWTGVPWQRRAERVCEVISQSLLVAGGVVSPSDFVAGDDPPPGSTMMFAPDFPANAVRDAGQRSAQSAAEEAEREAKQMEAAVRASLLEQQEREFAESLEADRARDEERLAQMRKETEAQAAAQIAVEAAVRTANESAERKAIFMSTLPPEIAANTEGAVLLTVRMPITGRRLSRAWEPTTTTETIYQWVEVAAQDEEEEGVGDAMILMESFPRKTYPRGDVSIQDAGITSHTVLVVDDGV